MFGVYLDVQWMQAWAKLCKSMKKCANFCQKKREKNMQSCTKTCPFSRETSCFLKNRSNSTFQPMNVCSKWVCLGGSCIVFEHFFPSLLDIRCLVSSPQNGEVFSILEKAVSTCTDRTRLGTDLPTGRTRRGFLFVSFLSSVGQSSSSQKYLCWPQSFWQRKGRLLFPVCQWRRSSQKKTEPKRKLGLSFAKRSPNIEYFSGGESGVTVAAVWCHSRSYDVCNLLSP